MKMKTITVRVRVIVEKDGDGFHAYVPDLKGVHACGDTEQEALAAAGEGVSLYLQSMIKHQHAIPMGMLVEPRGELMISRVIRGLKNAFKPSRPHAYLRDVTLPASALA